MNAGLRADPAVLRLHVDHGPVGGERHGQGAHDIQQFLEFHHWRERLGYRSQERQRIPLLDQRALPMLLGALAFRDFDAQAFVRPLERDRALLHTAVQFGVRTEQRLLVLPEQSLGGDTLCDIDGMAENVRRPARLLVQHVAVHPDARASVTRHDTHQTGVVPLVAEPLEVAVEQMACLGREKVREVRTNPMLGLITERMCGRWIDRQQATVQVVGADETETVFDEVAISSLALLERLFRLLPGCGDLVELTRSFPKHAPPGGSPSPLFPSARPYCTQNGSVRDVRKASAAQCQRRM